MLNELKKGDQVVTTSGIYGKINKYFDDKDYMMVEIAEKTIVKLQKAQVSSVVHSKTVKEVENDKTESEKK